MIYVPKYDFNNNCLSVIDSNTIRVFSKEPIRDVPASYIDYYIHSDYMFNEGTIIYDNDVNIPICIAHEKISTNYVYRVDFVNILLMFMVIGGFIVLVLTKAIKMFFRGWK